MQTMLSERLSRAVFIVPSESLRNAFNSLQARLAVPRTQVIKCRLPITCDVSGVQQRYCNLYLAVAAYREEEEVFALSCDAPRLMVTADEVETKLRAALEARDVVRTPADFSSCVCCLTSRSCAYVTLLCSDSQNSTCHGLLQTVLDNSGGCALLLKCITRR